jgi:hypothetical protein
MDEQMKKWVLQSASDEAFFAMTEEEFEERSLRLDFKVFNGIVDEEIIAYRERGYRRDVETHGKEKADEIKRMFGE